jgi:Cu(I)/Ag(I) efflux system protein CusF
LRPPEPSHLSSKEKHHDQVTRHHLPARRAGICRARVVAHADGEVRKIDKEAGKLTLEHAEIRNLGMPGMTMVFVVKDKTMLDKLQPGDKVKSQVQRALVNGAYVVTQLERAP